MVVFSRKFTVIAVTFAFPKLKNFEFENTAVNIHRNAFHFQTGRTLQLINTMSQR